MGFGNKDYPGGVLVQAVDQKGTGAIFGGEEGVQGSAYPFPALHCQARGLIPRQALFIFKKDRYVLHA
jgi:hypothetical protein